MNNVIYASFGCSSTTRHLTPTQNQSSLIYDGIEDRYFMLHSTVTEMRRFQRHFETCPSTHNKQIKNNLEADVDAMLGARHD